MKKVTLLILLLTGFILHSQTNEFFSTPKTYPVAPNAYQFTKYTEVPVSKYTGVPNISIPIYTVEAAPNDLNVPINLTYHSNGFRVSEEAGWTGLGWTLNGGGMITQIVNGYDDFKSIHPNRQLVDVDAIVHHASIGAAPVNYWTLSGPFEGITYAELSSGRFNISGVAIPQSASDEDFFQGNVDQYFDGSPHDLEPDVFNFSFLGYSGRFVLDWETETFKCLTDPKIKVSKSSNDHKEITITTPEGHIFVFSMKDEVISCYNIDCSDVTIGNGVNAFYGASSRVYKLDVIYTNKGNQIDFGYTTTSDFIYNFPYDNESYQIDESCWGCSISNNHTNVPTKQTHTYLSSITSKTNAVLFQGTTDRLDFIGTKKLNTILVLNSGRINKRFDLNYSYFIGHNNGVNTPYSSSLDKISTEFTHRLRLDSIVESGKPAYIFNYNNTQMSSKLSYGRDYWGYYNGVLTNINGYPDINRFNYDLSNDINYNAHISPLVTGNNRSSRLQYTRAGVLEKITYPTGGYVELDYELNSFTNAIVPNFTDTESTVYSPNRISYGAGIRVKEIKSFDSDNILLLKKTYEYVGGKLMTPVRFYNKAYLGYISGSHNNEPRREGWRQKISSSNFETPSVNAPSNLVGYSEVTEYLDSNDGNLETAGSIKYIFENHENKGVLFNSNTSLITDLNWQYTGKYLELNLPAYFESDAENGSLKEQLVYDNSQTLKKKTVTTYSYLRNFYIAYGARFGVGLPTRSVGSPHNIDCLSNTNLCAYTKYEKDFMFGAYAIGGLYTFIDSTEDIDYFDNGEISTKTEYEYNDYHQVTKQITVSSSGEEIENWISYTSSLPSFRQDNFLTSLKSKTVWKDNNLIGRFVYNYEDRNVPTSFPNSSSNGKLYFINKAENILANKAIDLVNDSNGNLVFFNDHDGGAITYYVWGYNKTKIIAKIENYTYSSSQISAISAAQSSSDNYNGSSSDYWGLRMNLTALRNAFPNSNVTTYIYDPSAGNNISEITDPRGNIVYYDYDEFQRLKYVKDKDGNILSENQYNYKN